MDQMFYKMYNLSLKEADNEEPSMEKFENNDLSESLRQKGNAIFKSAGADKEKILAAIRLYTEAIENGGLGSNQLPLAYSNRATALYKYGFYAEAYDDCCLALDYGIAKELKAKVHVRKLQCALKLQRLSDMSLLMQQLETVELESYLKNEVNTLQHRLQELLMQPMVEQTSDTTIEEPKNVVKILNGRTIITKTVQQNELVCTQQARWFVPTGLVNVCFNCANSLFIPYPCHHCIGSVIYCSVKCKVAHESIHKFECKGFKLNILNLNSNHLYFCFHIVVQELPKVVPLLRSKGSAEEILNIIDKNDDLFANNPELADYVLLLKHPKFKEFSFNPRGDFFKLVNYLEKHTNFFDVMKNTAAGIEEWKTVAGALMVCHSSQATSIDVQITTLGMPLEERQFLYAKNHWSDVLHLKRGILHKFFKAHSIGFAYFPYLSSCEHSCEANIYWAFNGTQLQIRATKEIQANEALNFSFASGHKECLQSKRSILLDHFFNFECKCKICSRPNPDMDYQKYHRYRCENRRCRRVFIPKIPDLPSLEWWNRNYLMMLPVLVHCTFCGLSQRYDDCLLIIDALLENFANPKSRLRIYDILNHLDQFLVEYHELKTYLYLTVLRKAITQLLDGLRLSALDIRKLLNIADYFKSAAFDQFGELSFCHLRAVLYLWDIIALTKCTCRKNEMEKLLIPLEKIPGTTKTVFMNYYEDYIKPQLI